MASELEKVNEIVQRVADSFGLEVVDVELKGGGKARMLRILIDKVSGVTHEDCANVSREVGTIFDVEDTVPGGSYTLEVSSPGLDRKLSKPADFQRFRGSLVRLRTQQPVAGVSNFEGRLKDFRNDQLVLETPAGKKHPATEFTIELNNVAKANLVPEF